MNCLVDPGKALILPKRTRQPQQLCQADQNQLALLLFYFYYQFLLLFYYCFCMIFIYIYLRHPPPAKHCLDWGRKNFPKIQHILFFHLTISFHKNSFKINYKKTYFSIKILIILKFLLHIYV